MVILTRIRRPNPFPSTQWYSFVIDVFITNWPLEILRWDSSNDYRHFVSCEKSSRVFWTLQKKFDRCIENNRNTRKKRIENKLIFYDVGGHKSIYYYSEIMYDNVHQRGIKYVLQLLGYWVASHMRGNKKVSKVGGKLAMIFYYFSRKHA